MRNDVADALDVVHLQIDRAFFVATLLQNEVVRLRLAVEPRLEIAEDLAGLCLAVDIENDVAREHREHFHPLFSPFRFALIAHLLGDVDDGDVEPGLPLVVHHVAAAVIYPHLGAVGTVQPVGDCVSVATLDLRGYLLGDPLTIVRVHHADEAVARNGAELFVGGAAEQLQHVAAYVVDRAALVIGAIAKQASGNAVEELLGYLIFNRAPVMRTELALGHPMKDRHNQPLTYLLSMGSRQPRSPTSHCSPTIIPPLAHPETPCCNNSSLICNYLLREGEPTAHAIASPQRASLLREALLY